MKPASLLDLECSTIFEQSTSAYELLYSHEYLPTVLDTWYYHHERWDDKRCPHSFHGEPTPLEVRIIKTVDALDALTSDQPYRKAWKSEGVKHGMQAQPGGQFDSRVATEYAKLHQVSGIGSGFQ